MYDQIIVCLDGFLFAEEIIPPARGLARALKARLTLLHVAERRDEVADAQGYLRELASRLASEWRVVVAEDGIAKGIVEELQAHPSALGALTTHGRTGLLETLLGSVAFSVVRDAGRPVLLYRPVGENAGDRETRITTVLLPLDGSPFAETMLPHAVDMARSLRARLLLVQVVPLQEQPFRVGELPPVDVVETGYLHSKAEEISRAHSLPVDWDVLHGEPAEAICDFLRRRPDTMLVMSSHARAGLTRTILGSVAAECVRRAGVPVLVYRPQELGPTD